MDEGNPHRVSIVKLEFIGRLREVETRRRVNVGRRVCRGPLMVTSRREHQVVLNRSSEG